MALSCQPKSVEDGARISRPILRLERSSQRTETNGSGGGRKNENKRHGNEEGRKNTAEQKSNPGRSEKHWKTKPSLEVEKATRRDILSILQLR